MADFADGGCLQLGKSPPWCVRIAQTAYCPFLHAENLLHKTVVMPVNPWEDAELFGRKVGPESGKDRVKKRNAILFFDIQKNRKLTAVKSFFRKMSHYSQLPNSFGGESRRCNGHHKWRIC